MSLCCEAAELLEHFVWLTEEESINVMKDPDQAAAIRQEIGDVINNLVYLCSALRIDPLLAAHDKIPLNEQKYPIDVAQEFSRRHPR
ncbi:MAG: nucleotide pyrophosphohydrolase [Verrucomicrobia bacterium]|nr:nucleotide pyrophosphohydrolase [Verrucomicrobiota bacterium]